MGIHFLLDEYIERDFGLRTVLNIASDGEIRSLSSRNVAGNNISVQSQLPIPGRVSEFGFDFSTDIANKITIRVKDGQNSLFEKGNITGGDSLCFSSKLWNFTNLLEKLKQLYDVYTQDTYKECFPWYGKIFYEKDSNIKSSLDLELINRIVNGDESIFMAVPSVVEWEKISKFQYFNSEHQDIEIDSFRSLLKKLTPEQALEKLKKTSITAMDLNNIAIYSWTAYKCLFADMDFHNKNYNLNFGDWFEVDKQFRSDIVGRYNDSYHGPFVTLPDCLGNNVREDQYSIFARNDAPEKMVLLDKETIPNPAGTLGPIEVCDLFSNNVLIHIKRYSGSSTLSHLFSQGFVSAELIKQYDSFFRSANDKISKVKKIAQTDGIKRDSFKVQYSIISSFNDEPPHIPFFSMVVYESYAERLALIGIESTISSIKIIPKND
jgi:uncharacterized protein (TIGR04141 family)